MSILSRFSTPRCALQDFFSRLLIMILVSPANKRGAHFSMATDLKMIPFEQPLTERVRGFLRLEHIFKSIATRLPGTSEWDSRSTLSRLIEVVEILSRYDIKAELIKELDRRYANWVRSSSDPEAGAGRQIDLPARLVTLLNTLKSPHCQPGQALRRDELVNTIRQRMGIPGGTCNFDMPSYHYWLNQPVDERIQQLRYWLNDLDIVEDCVALALSLIREGAQPIQVVAQGGNYHQSLDPRCPCSMIRIVLPMSWGLFPEISAGRQRFSLRFMEQAKTSERPMQTRQDVHFELYCCAQNT
jgi:cell division protein ZapD